MGLRDKAVAIALIALLFLYPQWRAWRGSAEQQVPSTADATVEKPTTVAASKQRIINPLLPDFSSYPDVREKKAAFFQFLIPAVEAHNQRILAQRQRLLQFVEVVKVQAALDEAQRGEITALAREYRLRDQQFDDVGLLQELLQRVDVVPLSLALSQSANESAWGTSRFALEGNNLFGQWCFKRGCGIVPAQRPAGAIYEVARFSSPDRSVASYIHNLNTNGSYKGFRQIRSQLRDRQLPLSGQVLAQGLLSYSARGEEYVRELQQMIRVNRLDRYDTI